jgi:PadR family transcriptional regulator PadR
MTQKLELLKGSSESLLLCLITRKPMYGYQIIKELETKSQGYFQFKEGTLYPALHRLEKSGLITGNWEMLENGRKRRYYHITEKGARLMEEKITQWQDFLNAMYLIIKPVNS